MKLTELKALMKQADRQDLEQALYDLYKSLTPKSRENTSAWIELTLKGHHPEPEKKKPEPVSVQRIQNEFDVLKTNLLSGAYTRSRSPIPKAERGKWRLDIKRWIKDLQTIPVTSKDYEQSCDLLFGMMHLCAEASTTGAAPGDHVFKSIGYSPMQLAEITYTHFLAGHSGAASWEKLIEIAAQNDIWLSRKEMDDWLFQETSGYFMALVRCAKTDEARENLFEACNQETPHFDGSRVLSGEIREAALAVLIELKKYAEALSCILHSFQMGEFILNNRLTDEFEWLIAAGLSKNQCLDFYHYLGTVEEGKTAVKQTTLEKLEERLDWVEEVVKEEHPSKP